MRRWLSFLLVLVMCSWAALPIVACAVTGPTAAARDCGCCQQMAGMNGGKEVPQSVACCASKTQPADLMATMVNQETAQAPQMIGMLPASMTGANSAANSVDHQYPVAAASPPSISVLRI